MRRERGELGDAVDALNRIKSVQVIGSFYVRPWRTVQLSLKTMHMAILVSHSTSMLIGGLLALLSLAPPDRIAAQATPATSATLGVRGDVQMRCRSRQTRSKRCPESVSRSPMKTGEPSSTEGYSSGKSSNARARSWDQSCEATPWRRMSWRAPATLRIVAPRDTRPARSIRMLERLEVVQLKK